MIRLYFTDNQDAKLPIDKQNTTAIKQFPQTNGYFKGRYFIVKYVVWFSQNLFLHNDLTWQKDAGWHGSYGSREEAEKTLEKVDK